MMLPFTRRVADRIENTMNEQDSFGLEKYGKPLDPLDDYDWLDMAEQELADCLKYFNAEREKRDLYVGNAIRGLEYVKKRITDGDYMDAHATANAIIDDLKYLLKKR